MIVVYHLSLTCLHTIASAMRICMGGHNEIKRDNVNTQACMYMYLLSEQRVLLFLPHFFAAACRDFAAHGVSSYLEKWHWWLKLYFSVQAAVFWPPPSSPGTALAMSSSAETEKALQ